MERIERSPEGVFAVLFRSLRATGPSRLLLTGVDSDTLALLVDTEEPYCHVRILATDRFDRDLSDLFYVSGDSLLVVRETMLEMRPLIGSGTGACRESIPG